MMLFGCNEYDDTELRTDIENLEERIASLEAWQKTVNTDIQSLQQLVAALENKNFITNVAPVTENGKEVGYTITFEKGNPITIRHGKDGVNGETPVIGVAKETDELYYWTLNGEFLTDPATGNKIPVTGEKGDPGDPGAPGAAAIAPQVRIDSDSNEWEISTDGGKTWTSTGVNATGADGADGADGAPGTPGAQGDAVFAKDGVVVSDDGSSVTFTLADGNTTFTVPIAHALTVGFESYDKFMLTPTSNVVAILLPATFQEEDYTALVAEIKSDAGTAMDISTRAAALPWQVELADPTFANGVYQNDAQATVTAPEGVSDGDRAILKITLIDAKGQELSVSRVLEYFNGVAVDTSQAGGLSAALEDSTPADIEALKVTGTLDAADFAYIRENLSSLETLDISDSDMTVFPNRGLRFDGLSPNTTLQKVVLPEGLTAIEDAAFANCTALEEINVPSTVATLGRWILENTKVAAFTIPEAVTEIPMSCFHNSALTSIEIPASVQTIGAWAFENPYFDNGNQSYLTSVNFAGTGITEIPEGCFIYQKSLATVDLPEGVTSIGADAFNQCIINDLRLPSTVEVIEARAFSNNGITELTLPNSLRVIENSAFSYNDIATIDLPASIESVASCAFHWESSALRTVICRAATVPEMPTEFTDEFGTYTYAPFLRMEKDNVVLKVPAESLDAYQTAWGTYFKEVVAID